jgi:hypothetical protein
MDTDFIFCREIISDIKNISSQFKDQIFLMKSIGKESEIFLRKSYKIKNPP